MKKIIFPTNDGINVEEHFGHCKKFAVCLIENEEIVSVNLIQAPEHQPGLLPKFLGKQGANVIITGGMGQRAINLFKEQGIDVILGSEGKIEDVLHKYLNSNLVSKGSGCQH